MQPALRVPDFSERFNRELYATYLSYVSPRAGRRTGGQARRPGQPGRVHQVGLVRTDLRFADPARRHPRQSLPPREDREVPSGRRRRADRFRPIDRGTGIIEYRVQGEEYRVVDIPPGYTHAITNVGAGEMITLFWPARSSIPTVRTRTSCPVEPRERHRESRDHRRHSARDHPPVPRDGRAGPLCGARIIHTGQNYDYELNRFLRGPGDSPPGPLSRRSGGHAGGDNRINHRQDRRVAATRSNRRPY